MRSLIAFICAVICAVICSVAFLEPALARPRNWPKIDPKKKTVCTMTLNSSDEAEVFEKHLKDFNFIELTDYGTNDWLGEACDHGVKCDVLLISGHFGGSFFGYRGHKISLEAMEGYSCRRECDGILRNPREVFLFGCNTLAGKANDGRTVQQYIEVLRAYGFSMQESQQIAAYRYSMVGSSFRTRMEKVFATVPKVYGFAELSPVGPQMRSHVESYLKWIGPYDKHLTQLSTTPNTKLASTLKGSSFIERTGAPIGNSDNSPVCVLTNKSAPNLKKVTWIRDVLKDSKKIMEYAPQINAYLLQTKRDGYKWTPQERDVLNEIASGQKTRESFESFINHPMPGLLTVQIRMANLAKMLGWWSAERHKEGITKLLGNVFRENVDWKNKDMICSLDTEVDVGLEALPRRPWDINTLWTIECMKPTDVDVHLALIDIVLRDQNGGNRFHAARALKAIQPADEPVLWKLIDGLSNQDGGVRANCEDVLREIVITDQRMIEKIKKYNPFFNFKPKPRYTNQERN